MLNRVTNLTMSANAQRTLQTQQSRLAELQDKATTLNKISRPSDDPAATAKALDTRSLPRCHGPVRPEHRRRQHLAHRGGLRTGAGHQRDAPDQGPHRAGRQRLAAAVRQGRHRRRAGGPEQGSGLDRQHQAPGPEHLRRQLGYRGVHPGTPRDPSIPATPARRPPSTGPAISPVERRISATQTVRVDADGAAIFGSGAGSVFDTVSQVAADLRSGRDITSRLASVDDCVQEHRRRTC